MVTDDVARIAEQVVRERFPDARAAWLGGSAATGSMTATSDLDVTVLLPSTRASFRESFTVGAQPVEIFVHTEESLSVFCDRDRRRRRPTLLRLIGTSIVLLDVDGIGRRLQEQYGREDRDGPPAFSAEEADAGRYAVTDLVEDLRGGGPEALSIAASLWRETAELILGVNARWSGSGKWLYKELHTLDADRGTNHTVALLSGVAAVGRGDVAAMQDAVDAALDMLGGRLFDGYRRDGIQSPQSPPAPRLNGDGDARKRRDVEIRTATADDLPFVRDMARHACVIEDWPLPEADSEEVQSLLPEDRDLSVVACEPSGELLGAAWTFRHEPPLVLDDDGAALPEMAVAVAPSSRGSGVGSALVDELIARCTGSYQALTLNVHHRNPAARLYRRVGFRALGQGRGALGIAMRRNLS